MIYISRLCYVVDDDAHDISFVLSPCVVFIIEIEEDDKNLKSFVSSLISFDVTVQVEHTNSYLNLKTASVSWNVLTLFTNIRNMKM